MCLPAAQAITVHNDGLGAAVGKTPQHKSGVYSVLLHLLLLLLVCHLLRSLAGSEA